MYPIIKKTNIAWGLSIFKKDVLMCPDPILQFFLWTPYYPCKFIY